MVRIWRAPVAKLDRQHLLGEHVELHVILNALRKKLKGIKGGWQHHPQTLRFEHHLGMLYDRHNQQIKEMARRGYNHNSPLPNIPHKPEPYVYSNKEMKSDMDTLNERGVKPHVI